MEQRQQMSRIAPADRPSIELEDDVLDPRAQSPGQTHGMSERTAARKLREHTRYVAGVAYVFRERSKREFAGLEFASAQASPLRQRIENPTPRFDGARGRFNFSFD